MRKKSVVFFTQLIKTDISVQLFSRFNNLHRTTTSYNLRQLQILSLIYSKHKDYYFQNCIYEAMWLSNHTNGSQNVGFTYINTRQRNSPV